MTAPLRDALVERLEVENDVLRERVRQLEEMVFGDGGLTPIEWGLTTAEERLFHLLAQRQLVTKDAAMAGLYRDLGKDEADPKIVDVFVCKIRKKLAPYGVGITTRWGQGYELDAATRARFRQPAPGLSLAREA